ncbi:MAG TPA: family 78 glycoside hydrolase catalytic domain [Opitutaceae bacterium]|nr:family 78 glycoside hydrolase catalytic domain [Opitutaceae bacterium]
MPTILRRLLPACVLLFSGLLHAQAVSPVRLAELTTEHLHNPIGLGVAQPRLSWKLVSTRDGEKQTAYEVRAAATAAALTGGQSALWNSGKVASDQSVLVPWGGTALGSRSQVFWQVRIWDKDGAPTAWSEPASFELGLLDSASEWKGHWITADLPRYDIEQPALGGASWISGGSAANQAAAIRLALDLPADAKVLGATIDAAADGLIALYVNGQPTRQGSTSHTAPFHADFGVQLKAGRNIIALESGAVRGARGGPRNALAAHGDIELQGGRHIAFNTDGSWKAAAAPGAGWFAAAFDDSAWPAATVLGAYHAQDLSENAGGTIGPGRYLRRSFTVKGPVARARLYATALGVYEASINGQRVNDHQLDPGFTDYNKRVMVQTTDVTALLKPGANVVGALLSDGWFAGRLGWMGLAQYAKISSRPLFGAQLEITYADGSRDVIATDASWKGGAGEVVGADEQVGEVIDARRTAAWDQPAFDDSRWAAVAVESHDGIALDPQRGPPVRRLMELAPKKITHRGNAWVVDLGQNMVGHVRLSARGPAGTTVTVTHAEMINADGTLYAENLRTALSIDTFTLGGRGRETFEPHFTFHGFRYVEIAGYPGELKADDIRGIVVGSDNPATGAWESSDKDLNQLFSNITWGQRSNFLSVPTDCPQRDERLGWMGDAQVFSPTAVRNADVAGFFTKWLVDVNDAQGPNGEFSTVSPRANQNNSWPVWGDAGVIIPWVAYTAYGDKAFLADNYDHMARWVDYCRKSSNNLILTGGVGDHLAPMTTPTNIVDTAFFAKSARIVARAAAILGKTEDAAKYEKLRQDIIAAFNAAFVGADGSITAAGGMRGPRGGAAPAAGGGDAGARAGNTQTAYMLALKFDLLPQELRPVVAKRLADDVAQNGHLTTGFVGVGLICPMLTEIGRSDLAWQLVFTDSYPSWLFSVRNGATTIWERWDGWTPEKGFQASSMNSFNHYSLGSVGAWLYTGAAGIGLDEAQPGYKHFTLAPQFTSRLAHVKASLDTPYGVIGSYWHAEKDQMVYDVIVPPNTTAELELPVAARDVREGGQAVSGATGDTTKLALAAGVHRFSFPRSALK